MWPAISSQPYISAMQPAAPAAHPPPTASRPGGAHQPGVRGANKRQGSASSLPGFRRVLAARILSCAHNMDAEPEPEPAASIYEPVETYGVNDYGPLLSGDHRYTPPHGRLPSSCALRTAQEYAELGGVAWVAGADAFRTHDEDEDPVVCTFDNLLTSEECQHIKQVATPKLRRAGVTTDSGKGGRTSDGRTNELAWVPHDSTPGVFAVIERVANFVGLPVENAESLQVIRYAEGQRYNKHTDAYDPTNERGKNACQDGGNRVLVSVPDAFCSLLLTLPPHTRFLSRQTALIYLSEVEEGGATGFINLRLNIDPHPGRLLAFHNCYRGSASLHPDSLHAGCPVIKGTKWAVSALVRSVCI